MTRPVIGYAGMTHLGLISASAAAGQGFRTVAFDPDAALIGRLTSGDLPVREPHLPELIGRHKRRSCVQRGRCGARRMRCGVRRRRCADRRRGAERSCADQGHGRARAAKTRRQCAARDPFAGAARLHPRAAGAGGAALLSGRDPGVRPRGRARHQARALHRRLRRPATVRSPPALQTFLESFCCPILPMAYESAELAKISINFCLVASITVANTLAELCERIGADWSRYRPRV